MSQVRAYIPAKQGFDHPKMLKQMSAAGMRRSDMGIPKGYPLRYDIEVFDVQKLMIDKKLWDVLELEVEHHKRMNCKKEDVPNVRARRRPATPVGGATARALPAPDWPPERACRPSASLATSSASCTRAGTRRRKTPRAGC